MSTLRPVPAALAGGPLAALIGERELDAAGIRGAALRAGYLRCRALGAEHGRTFHLATLLLPPERRPFVHALYGLARYVDDIVDAPGPASTGQRAERLEAWTSDLLADLDWGAASHPVARAAIDTFTRWSIPASYFSDFVASMRMDLTVSSYQTYDDLTRYTWGSAAVIGLQLLPILGRADESVRPDVVETHAIALGTAFQLTNFLRDVGEDLRRGRVYLPQESLDRFGVDRDRLARGRVDEPIRNLLAWEIERTRRLYAQAEPGIELVAATSRECVRTATRLYAGILDSIERADYDVFSSRARVGWPRRAAVGLVGARYSLAARRVQRRHGGPPTPTGSA
jgi:phytoene synthase